MSRIVLFFLVILFYNLYAHQKYGEDKKKKYFLMAVGAFFILESALRHLGVGPDTYHYYEIFEQAKNTTYDRIANSLAGTDPHPIKDPFYWLFQKVFQIFFPKFRLFLFFIAILFFSSLNRFLLRNHLSLRDMMIAYLFYLGMFHSFFSYTGLRQTIAVAIIFHSTIYLFDGKNVKSLACTFLAFLFHSSASVFLLAYCFRFVRNPRIFLPIMLSFMFLFIVLKEYIMLYVLYSTGLEDRFERFATAKTEGAGSFAVTLLYLIVFAFLFMSYRKIAKDRLLFNHFQYYCFVVACLPIMYMDNSAFRIASFFSISMYVLIPFMVSQIKFRQKYLAIYSLFFLLLLFSALKSDYCFYWQNMAMPAYGFSSFSEPFL